jgi:hypothetical protein
LSKNLCLEKLTLHRKQKEDAAVEARANVKDAATTRTARRKDALVLLAPAHVTHAPTQRKRPRQGLAVVHRVNARAIRLAATNELKGSAK